MLYFLPLLIINASIVLFFSDYTATFILSGLLGVASLFSAILFLEQQKNKETVIQDNILCTIIVGSFLIPFTWYFDIFTKLLNTNPTYGATEALLMIRDTWPLPFIDMIKALQNSIPFIGFIALVLCPLGMYKTVERTIKKHRREIGSMMRENKDFLNAYKTLLLKFSPHTLPYQLAQDITEQVKSMRRIILSITRKNTIQSQLIKSDSETEYIFKMFSFEMEHTAKYPTLHSVKRCFVSSKKSDIFNRTLDTQLSRVRPRTNAEYDTNEWRKSLRTLEDELVRAATEHIVDTGGVVYGEVEPPYKPALWYSTVNALFPIAHNFPTQRHEHTYVVGSTGSGKSTLLRNLIAYDLAETDRTTIVMAAENSLFDAILPYIPAPRDDDVIYFKAEDITGNVIGFNPLDFRDADALAPEEREIYLTYKAGETATIFKRALGELGRTMEPVLDEGISALIQHEGAVVTDLARLIDPHDDTFRRAIISSPHMREGTREFWANYEKSSYYQRSYDALRNALRPFFQAPLKEVLSVSSFSFDDVINGSHARILFCNLSGLPESSRKIVGQLFTASVQQALVRREKIPVSQYRETFFYIDEFALYAANTEQSFKELFFGARKYHAGITVSHQVIGDVPSSLLDSMLGNVGTVIALRIRLDKDAATLARRLNIHEFAEITPKRNEFTPMIPTVVTDPERHRGSILPLMLKNLDQGQAFVITPDHKSAMPVTVPSPPPCLSESHQDTGNLIARSKNRFGKRPPTTPTSERPPTALDDTQGTQDQGIPPTTQPPDDDNNGVPKIRFE